MSNILVMNPLKRFQHLLEHLFAFKESLSYGPLSVHLDDPLKEVLPFEVFKDQGDIL